MVFFEPHNVTYLVYAELGLIGLLLFGFIVYKIAYIAWQNFRMADTVELKIVTSATGGHLSGLQHFLSVPWIRISGQSALDYHRYYSGDAHLSENAGTDS